MLRVMAEPSTGLVGHPFEQTESVTAKILSPGERTQVRASVQPTLVSYGTAPMETTLLKGVSGLLLLSEPQTLICDHCEPCGTRPLSVTGKFAGG